MQIQGIPPPCRDIQKNCDATGPVAAETYSPAELIAANAVSSETARDLAERVCSTTIGSNASGRQVCCPDTGLTGEPISLYDISGTKLYYRFSGSNGSGGCAVFIKANKLLGAPIFSIRSGPDCLDNLTQRTAAAKLAVLADHPGYRIPVALAVVYRENGEGIRFTLVNTETNTSIKPVLDLC
ncbi:MAG: hypothetical protein ABFC24_04170, partial [Methanoregulaceae archaeon]